MSHFVNVTTQIKDRQALIRALCRMGFTEKQIEIYENGSVMKDYYGGKKTANVIIRSTYTGIPSDIGFQKQADGSYTAYVDEFQYSGRPRYNDEWQKKLFTYYGVEAVKMSYEKRRIEYFEEIDDQKRIRLRARI